MRKLFKIIPLVLLTVLFFVNPVQAKMNFSVGPTISAPIDKTITDMMGFEIKAEWKNIFLALSKDSAFKILVGQSVGDFEIYGATIGYDLQISNHLSISCGLGYYQPKMKFEPEMKEAIYRKMHELSDPVDGWCTKEGTLCCEGHEIDYDMNTGEYVVHGALGGLVKIDFDLPITDHIGISMFVGYRILEFRSHISSKIKGLPPRVEDGMQAWHIFGTDESLSGPLFGLFLNIYL